MLLNNLKNIDRSISLQMPLILLLLTLNGHFKTVCIFRYGVIQGQSERCVPLKWVSPERMMAGKMPITSKSDV